MKRTWAAIVAISSALALTAATPAAAFDGGPHAEITEDAMSAEGFNLDAIGVARINNWFVDLYAQAEKNPFSGHGGFLKRVLTGVIQTENWSDEVISASLRAHFDVEPGVPPHAQVQTLKNTEGVTAEWNRLRRAVGTLAREARDKNDPEMLLAVLGMSLHQVQDFYAHSNWVEPQGTPGIDGPGWKQKGVGSTPTWSDMPASVRDTLDIYGDSTHDRREHGYWNSDGNAALSTMMNKDWPGRPHYLDAAISAYYATRQWVQAVRLWVDDEAFWARAQRYVANQEQLDHDLRGGFEISLYLGHWQGQGEPLGGTRGPGGSLFNLRQAIKHYFQPSTFRYPGQLRDKTGYRARFERLITRMADPNPPGEVGPIPSSQELQRRTRVVVLRITSMRSEGLGDPGPDDADMFAEVKLDGQWMTSAVVHGYDRFNFGDPHEPFTWFKVVPAVPNEGEPVESIEVEVKTADARWAGTDDDIHLVLGPGLRFPLDKRLDNDFERGDRDVFSVPIDAAVKSGMRVGNILRVQIDKARDGLAGGWKLDGVKLRVNGRVVYDNQRIDRWMENDRRSWVAPDFVRRAPRGTKIPVWLYLGEDDLLYGDDDRGDINPNDRRDSVSIGYAPGPPVEATIGGGNLLKGRLGYGGDEAEITYRLETIAPQVMVPVDQPPGPTTTELPDLTISKFTASEITVTNRGGGPAGPFDLLAGSARGEERFRFRGLPAGASETRLLPFACEQGPYFAQVDDLGDVAELDETNNLRDEAEPEFVIC